MVQTRARANPLPFVGQSGRRFDWGDVSSHLDRLLNKRFGQDIERDVLEDARQEALLDLLEKWVTQKDAWDQDVDGYRFEYALNHGMKRAGKYIKEENERQYMEVLYAFGDGPESDAEDHPSTAGAYIDFADPSPGPEELAVENDEYERARLVLASLSAEELATCFELMDGGSTRELAEKLGVSHVAVIKRQSVARKFLKHRARQFGLEPSPEPMAVNTAGRTPSEQDAYDRQLAEHHERRDADLAWMKGGRATGDDYEPEFATVSERGSFESTM